MKEKDTSYINSYDKIVKAAGVLKDDKIAKIIKAKVKQGKEVKK